MGIFVYSYAMMMQDIEWLRRKYESRLKVRLAGRSVLGREIPELIVGGEEGLQGRTDETLRHVLIHAGMHGREYLNCALVMRQTEDFLKEKAGYGKVCFHVLPMVNPDGVEICQRHDALWKANGRGVDLNRNFDAGWETYRGQKEPGGIGYKGERPGSEPEVQVILDIEKKHSIAACISYHSTGSIIYWDYGCTGKLKKAEERLAGVLAEVTGYQIRSTVKSRADEAGCSDYFVQKCGIPAVTIETGRGKCPLEETEFGRIYEENRRVWEKTALFVREADAEAAAK